MKTKVLTYTLLFLSTVFLFSQNKADHFQKIVDTTTNPTLKLANLDSLYLFYRDKNLTKEVFYAQKYIDFAYDIQEYEEAIERSITIFHIMNIDLGQREKALKMIEKAEKYLDKTNDTYLLGGVYLKKGGAYSNGKSYEKARDNFTLAIEKYGPSDSIYKADAIYFRGQSHFWMGNYLKAIEDYKLASKYYENLRDQTYMFYTMGAIISIYGINGFTEKSIEERAKMIDKKLKTNFLHGLSIDYINQFASYKKTDSIEKQEDMLLKSIQYIPAETSDNKQAASIYSIAAKFYANYDLKKSETYLTKASEIIQSVDKNTVQYNRFKIAEAYYLEKKGNFTKALNIYLNSLKIAEDSKNTTHILEINKRVSNIYESKGDYKKASKYFKKHTTLKDSIFNRTKLNALAYYQTLYETEKKELEISKQQSAINVLATENERKTQLIIFGGVGLLLAFLIILLYRNRRYLKRKNELQASFSQHLLLSQDEERKRISKDLHDSLGQSLLLVKNNLINESKNTKELLNDAIDEMRSISRNLYPIQLKELGITAAINNLIKQLDKSYPDTYIFGDIDNIDGSLTAEQELNLYRIIQECLSNIVKHSNAESAKIELAKKNEEIIITLQDNGVGFDFSKKFKNFKSLGLKTIKERVRYLNGILHVESNEKEGSKFNISIQTS